MVLGQGQGSLRDRYTGRASDRSRSSISVLYIRLTAGLVYVIEKEDLFFFCLDDIYLYCTLKIDRIVPHCKSFLWP